MIVSQIQPIIENKSYWHFKANAIHSNSTLLSTDQVNKESRIEFHANDIV